MKVYSSEDIFLINDVLAKAKCQSKRMAVFNAYKSCSFMLLLLICFADLCRADRQEPKAISDTSPMESKSYKVGFGTESYLPFQHVRDGEITGFYRDLLDMYAQEQGIVFQYKLYPVDDLHEALRKKIIDFKIPANPYWKSESKQGLRYDYSKPILDYIDGVSVRSNMKDITIGELKVLGKIRGFTPFNYQPFVRIGKIEVVESDSVAQLIMLLQRGEVDGIYANVDVVSSYARNMGIADGKVVFNKKLPYTFQSYLLATTKRWLGIKRFNDFLEKNQIPIEKLAKKYGIRNTWDILDN